MKTTLLLSVLCAVMAVAASQACGNETCATDEICNNITNTCQCNTTFYTFTPGSRPSPNFTCTGVKFNIQVSKCWLEKQGYNTSEIRLNSTDSECFAVRELVDGKSEMTIHRPMTSSACNTESVINSSHVTYSNLLSFFAKTNPISITNDIAMNISCSYPLNINVILNVTLKPVIGTTVISSPTGNGSYAAVMMAYKDSQYTTLLTEDDPLTVENTIYLSVTVPDLDVNTFKLKVVNIYASPTNSSDQQYYLLNDG
ncbi:uromodulin-like [Rana temporaria]|uniref:uromodulin-like n=1 Tax=Rana temporaria TaxID=8407 RepID=UPI001AAD7872|nr:uromodulin-like [Rana temporaria]